LTITALYKSTYLDSYLLMMTSNPHTFPGDLGSACFHLVLFLQLFWKRCCSDNWWRLFTRGMPFVAPSE